MSALPEHDESHAAGDDTAGAIRARVLVVDDDPDLRTVAAGALRRAGAVVVAAESLQEARETMAADTVDLVLADLRLPTGSGLDLLGGATDGREPPPVVVMTGYATDEVADVALGMGAYGVLAKPFTPQELVLAVKSGVQRHAVERAQRTERTRLEHDVELRTQELEAALARVSASERDPQAAALRARQAEEETVVVLSRAVGGRDPESGDHNERVGAYAEALARASGWLPEDAYRLSLAARLHDLGKVEVPDAILHKPGALTAAERAVMKEHCRVGFRLLHGAASPILQLAAQVSLSHHERWDGTGYPGGLRGERIPLAGRIVAIADVFDALTSDRPYRPRMSVEDAHRILLEERGGHFDPEFAELFVSLPDVAAILERRVHDARPA